MVNSARTVPPVRTYIADDSYLIREGLATLLALSSEVRVEGKFADYDGLIAAVKGSPPDVVVTDMRMPPTQTDEGMRIAEWLTREHPGVGVVVLSQHGSVRYAAQLLESGAAGRGYLLKDRIHDLDHLVSTITAVARGECRIDAQLVEGLVRARRAKNPIDALTARQKEILADIARGQSNAAIAMERGLSLRAVEKHVSEVFGRLGIASDESISRRVHATLMFMAQEGP